LLSSLSEDELRAVVAHEAGHLRRSHLLFFAVALFGFMELLLLGAGTASVVSWWQGWEIPLWAEGVVMVAALLGFLRFGVGFLSRQFERQADCHALERVGLRPFGQALLKVSWLNGIDPETPNWHHYGVLQRLRFLSECEAQPELRERHHQRVLHLKGALLAGALLLLGVNAYFTSADARIRLLGYYLTSVSSTAEPTLAPLMVRLADLLYFEKELGQAESWYRKSLVLNADSPRALNNLAWLLTERYGDNSEHMRESVLLAQQALEQDEQAFIWDTLAEGHWQLGQRQQALEAAEHAWFLADSRNPPLPEAKLRYYKERLEVFRGR
jgi:predicted Zn-dependent protease